MRSIFKVIIEVRNYFLGKKRMIHEVGYPEESDMPRSDMRGSTVLKLRLLRHLTKEVKIVQSKLDEDREVQNGIGNIYMMFVQYV